MADGYTITSTGTQVTVTQKSNETASAKTIQCNDATIKFIVDSPANNQVMKDVRDKLIAGKTSSGQAFDWQPSETGKNMTTDAPWQVVAEAIVPHKMDLMASFKKRAIDSIPSSDGSKSKDDIAAILKALEKKGIEVKFDSKPEPAIYTGAKQAEKTISERGN